VCCADVRNLTCPVVLLPLPTPFRPIASPMQLGAHMLRLHVVLNSPDGVEVLRQPDLAVLTGKATMTHALEDTRPASRVSAWVLARGGGGGGGFMGGGGGPFTPGPRAGLNGRACCRRACDCCA
jgi:hypothetical protein